MSMLPGSDEKIIYYAVYNVTGGVDLAKTLVETSPALKILLMSGFTDVDHLKESGLESKVGFLAKPFTPDDLARAVEERLAS